MNSGEGGIIRQVTISDLLDILPARKVIGDMIVLESRRVLHQETTGEPVTNRVTGVRINNPDGSVCAGVVRADPKTGQPDLRQTGVFHRVRASLEG